MPPRAGVVHHCVTGVVALVWLATFSSGSRSIVTGNHYGDVWWLEDLDSADTTKRTWQQKHVGKTYTGILELDGEGLAQAPGYRGSLSALVVHYSPDPEGRVFDMTDPRDASTFVTNAAFPTPSVIPAKVATAPDGPCLPRSEATKLAFVTGNDELLCIERKIGFRGAVFKSRFTLKFSDTEEVGWHRDSGTNRRVPVAYNGRGRVYVALLFINSTAFKCEGGFWHWEHFSSSDPAGDESATANLEWRIYSADATAPVPRWTRERTLASLTSVVTSKARNIADVASYALKRDKREVTLLLQNSRAEGTISRQIPPTRIAATGNEVYVLVRQQCGVQALSTGNVTKLQHNTGGCSDEMELAVSQGRLYVVFDSGVVVEIDPRSGAQRVVVAAAATSIAVFRVHLSGMAILNDCTATTTTTTTTATTTTATTTTTITTTTTKTTTTKTTTTKTTTTATTTTTIATTTTTATTKTAKATPTTTVITLRVAATTTKATTANAPATTTNVTSASQPPCLSGQYLQGASNTTSGTCTACNNATCSAGHVREGSCSGASNGYQCIKSIASGKKKDKDEEGGSVAVAVVVVLVILCGAAVAGTLVYRKYTHATGTPPGGGGLKLNLSPEVPTVVANQVLGRAFDDQRQSSTGESSTEVFYEYGVPDQLPSAPNAADGTDNTKNTTAPIDTGNYSGYAGFGPGTTPYPATDLYDGSVQTFVDDTYELPAPATSVTKEAELYNAPAANTAGAIAHHTETDAAALYLVDDAKVGSPLQANGLGEITLVVTTPLGMLVNHADNNTGMVVSRLAHRGNASTAGVTPGMLVKAINGVDTRSLTIKAFVEHVKNTPQGGEVHLVLTDPSNMYGAVQGFTETYDAPAANTAGTEHYAAADTSRLYMVQSPPADTTPPSSPDAAARNGQREEQFDGFGDGDVHVSGASNSSSL